MRSASVSANPPDLTATLIRLMLSINDIALAKDANAQWAETADRKRAAIRGSGRRYFVRVMLSHIHEGLLIVEDISRSQLLRSSVDECDQPTISDFRVLENVIKSPEMELLRKLRSRATFHYDEQLPFKSFQEIAKDQPDRAWSYSEGSEPLDWRFELAEAVMERMMHRKVFGLGLPGSDDLTAQTEDLAKRLEDISRKFTRFAFRYVEHFSRA
jgi:hypothetical protein